MSPFLAPLPPLFPAVLPLPPSHLPLPPPPKFFRRLRRRFFFINATIYALFTLFFIPGAAGENFAFFEHFRIVSLWILVVFSRKKLSHGEQKD